ncbi:MAG: NYN domain-containing protein [Rhodoferax sp.]|uniref:NYN domain-containing protein n=1 Tax=Rhodoferax sp. TaxID=50421 RepID=UPI00183DDCF7|nr:NYN domain-containing protein [Rhodoferax sp.]NMM13728.1 NYN domain-containing protein [Rhodoferax sp.]NMM20455.1 NYN domain-containing protein [Rhodoferax sp.]
MNVFLIDADNLSASAWVDEAFRVLEESEGVMPVRRAYGSAENLKGLADVLRVWAVRPFVNLSLTKNTTDIALAVDAMEFACQTPAPKLVVIGSGDADFVPLVVRLRERGIRMVCVSERGKMGREAVSAYDRVILVGPEQALHEAQLAGTPLAPVLEAPVGRRGVARKTAAKKVPAVKAPAAKTPVKKVVAKKVVTRTPTVKKTPVRKTVANENAPATVTADGAANPSHTVDVAAILQAVPALQSGQPQPLAVVAKALLDAKLRGKNLTSTKVLKKFPQHFALLPPEKPRTVTYTPPQDLA